MEILSRILFFLSHNGFYSAIFFLLLGALYIYINKKGVWIIPVVIVLIMANAIAAQFLNAWFLNAFGTRGMAIITQSIQTSSKLNNSYIYDYDAVVKTAEGKDVVTAFSTTSAAIYPIRNRIKIPRTNTFFPVKYIPGYEKNIVILNDESADGIRQNASERMRPVEKARIQYQVSPQNKIFIKEYADALQTWINQSTEADSLQVQQFRNTIDMLQKQQ